MKTIFFIFSVIIFFTNTILAQGLKVGDQAPEITITDYIQNTPQDTSRLNKYILLEFWATWCAPCLGAVPHLNELQEKHKRREDILFLSMTYEEPKKVLKTTNRIPFTTSVVSDQSKKTFQNYGADTGGNITVPKTVLIDNKGIIKWIGHPNHLNDTLFANFVNGKAIPDTERTKEADTATKKSPEKFETKDILDQLLQDEQTNYLFSLSEKDSNDGVTRSMKQMEQGIYLIINDNCLAFLSDLLSVHKRQLSIPESIKNKRYDLFYKNIHIKDAKACSNDIKENLLKALDLKEWTEKRKTDIYLLTIVDESKLNVSEETDGYSHSGTNSTHLTFSNTGIESVIKVLSDFHQIVIRNETNLPGMYDFLIHRGSIEDLTKDLESYGLTLKKTQEEILFYNYKH